MNAPTPYPGGPEAGLSDNIHRIFHALGDPTRRALVERLSEAPVTVSQLAEPLAITLAAVVQHLQILEDAGLVKTEKLGRVRTCRIESAGLDLAAQWLNHHPIQRPRRVRRPATWRPHASLGSESQVLPRGFTNKGM